jgi:RES domain-containing protein
MIVYRLVNSMYGSDLSGEGARLNGGRWNHMGTSCVYTSESRALAVLEFSVNVGMARILRHLSMIQLEIPDNILEVHIPDLPGNWKDAPAPSSTRDFGTNLLNAATHPIIKIPSTVISEEFNYLINPKHPLSRQCKIIDKKDFVYDIRIKIT